MNRYIALLKGINVGKANRIPMAGLRELLSGCGYEQARTHLNSGNAVFSALSADAATIEDAITAEYGFAVRCLVIEADYLHAVTAANPFPEHVEEGSRYLAHFLSDRVDLATESIHIDPANTHLGDRVIYQWCPDGVLAAPSVGGFVEKNWRAFVTARNWNTVTKLDDLARTPLS